MVEDDTFQIGGTREFFWVNPERHDRFEGKGTVLSTLL